MSNQENFVDLLTRLLTRERDEARALAERYLCEKGTAEGKVERARREGAEAMREAAAQACKAIYRDHKKSKSYPVDMGGLATECEAAVRALPLPGERVMTTYKVGDKIRPADGSDYRGVIIYFAPDEDTVEHRCLHTGARFATTYIGFTSRYMTLDEYEKARSTCEKSPGDDK